MDEYKLRMATMRGEFRGDVTRDSFDAAYQFSRVLIQQGRVQLDADFNEQASIMVHYLRGLAVDLMGPHAAPVGMDGLQGDDFKVSALKGENSLIVAPGHYYVNGIRCENRKEKKVTIPGKSKTYLVYLDVWERHIAAVEEDLIREVALNGPDTASRARIEWQVKFLANVNLKDKNYDTFLDALKAIRKPGSGKLRARARRREETDREPCLVDPEARYRGSENQLYRVEIHNGSQGNKATFKWSRENASVYFPIVKPVADHTVTVAHLGRDERFGLKPDDWVEITDDDEALTPERPPLLQVELVDPDNFEVTLKDSPSSATLGSDLSKHPYLRRWDHKADDPDGVPVTESNTEWIDLEDGVQIQFSGEGPTSKRYGAGDYWLIPARTITGDVEWPGPANDPESLPPHGIVHHYAPLALLTRGLKDTFTSDDLRRGVIKLWHEFSSFTKAETKSTGQKTEKK